MPRAVALVELIHEEEEEGVQVNRSTRLAWDDQCRQSSANCPLQLCWIVHVVEIAKQVLRCLEGNERSLQRRPFLDSRSPGPGEEQADAMQDVKEKVPALLAPLDASMAGGQSEEEEEGCDLCILLKREAGDQKAGHWTIRASNVLCIEGTRGEGEALVVSHEGVVNRIVSSDAPGCALPMQHQI